MHFDRPVGGGLVQRILEGDSPRSGARNQELRVAIQGCCCPGMLPLTRIRGNLIICGRDGRLEPAGHRAWPTSPRVLVSTCGGMVTMMRYASPAAVRAPRRGPRPDQDHRDG